MRLETNAQHVERLALSIAETAQVLGISVVTVRRRIADKSIHPVRIGRRALVPIAELDRLLNVSTDAA